MKERAQKLLEKMTGNQQAQFHEGQWEAINSSVNEQKQLLVVQRTGWGKSAVYFISTKLRREQGYGPTIIISPLLSLIRNQIESATKLGLIAVSYNSSMSTSERKVAEKHIIENKVDIIITTPEQLGPSKKFAKEILSEISNNIGMFVVDEAHCISDWGHDFRPDYQRIVRFLEGLPANIPVLATTATANDRVISDIQSQLGESLAIIRGTLMRESLSLQNIYLSSKSERLAWLAEKLQTIEGTGIIYAKTTKDCEIVSEFLQANNISSQPYHGSLKNLTRMELENDLLNNNIKVLVATSALGMGFDKPDLSFVIHYQAPGNIVEYYQQVGRAGRGLSHSTGTMMLGEEDSKIQQYFISNAFPKEDEIRDLLSIIEEHDGIKESDIVPLVNFSESKIGAILKFLSIKNPSQLLLDEDNYYHRTPFEYNHPYEKIDRLNKIKRQEWNKLLEYHQSKNCLMSFLGKELDDISINNCGKCMNCSPDTILSVDINDNMIHKANEFLRHRYIPIKPRSRFASSKINAQLAFPNYGFPYSIDELKCEIGYALSSWKDGGWGNLVAQGKRNNNFSDELIAPMIKMINSIPYTERPTWITYIPSPRHPNLVRNFALKLAQSLGIPCLDTVLINEIRPPQKTMENSFYQSKNLDGAFGIDESNIYTNPVWLIDDAVDSGWTFTIAGALLRQVGVSKVMPLALTSTKRNG